jgi:hypothetical protein
MSTLCRAGRRWRKYAGADLPAAADLSAIAAAATADAAKVGTSESPIFCRIHLSAFLKSSVNGGRKISGNPKNFGNISEKRPFPEKISDYFFARDRHR